MNWIATLSRYETNPVAKRAGALADQAAISLANFLLTIAIVRTYDSKAFAAYGLGMFLALALSGIYRNGIVIPVSLFPPSRYHRLRRRIRHMHSGCMIAVAATIAATVALFSLFGVAHTSILLVLSTGAFFLSYTSTDMDRVNAMKSSGVVLSLMISTIYALGLGAMSVSIFLLRPSLDGVLAFLLCGALLKVMLLNGWPHMRGSIGRSLLKLFLRRSLGWGALGSLSVAMYLTLPQWLLGVVSTPLQVAGFTAVRSPLQPLMLSLRAFDIVDKIAFGKFPGDADHTSARASVRTTIAYALTTLIFAGIATYFSDDIIRLVIGKNYEGFATTLSLTALSFVLIAVAAPMETIVFKKGMYRQYAYFQFAGLVAACAVMYPLVQRYEANGAVISAMIGWIPPYLILGKCFVENMRIGYSQKN